VSPPAVMLASAVVALAAAAAAIALERDLPAAIRLTPRLPQEADSGASSPAVDSARTAA
jgi:hypothetical protein